MYLNQATPAEVNREVRCFVMIGTVEAVENAADICATPGVNGVYMGPADLAISLGYSFGSGPLPTEHADAIAHVATLCADAGEGAGPHPGGRGDARQATHE